MKRFLLGCALALSALALPANLARAQGAGDVQYASVTNSELSDLYARLANLESRAVNNGGDQATGCGCCDDCSRAGFIAAGEVAWLKAFTSDNDFGDFNYREAYRFWVGYQRADGLGVRLRYFDYFQRANNGDFLDIYTVDLEAYDRIDLGCYWNLLIGGGFRVLGYQESSVGGGGALTDALWGVGPVVTAELYRYLGDNAALYAIGRQSIIVGSGFNGGNTQDDTGAISELQLGLQVQRDWGNSLVFARAGWETQAYFDIHDSEELVTLMGGVLSAGIMR